MEIVVNDTNVIIDLFNAGLLPYCKRLSIEFRTLDVVINEIKVDEQKDAVRNIIDEGTLSVHSLSGGQMWTVFQKVAEYRGVCNLSVEDISVMVYAQENGFRLLTGDRKLREKAANENVKVSGVLYVIDMMIKGRVVDRDGMVAALILLMESNGRLPRKLIEERIEKLKSGG